MTIQGERFVSSTQRFVEAAKWLGASGKVNGTSEEAKTINTYLDLIKHKLFVYQKELILAHDDLTIASCKAKWLGKSEESRMIMDVFRIHNKKKG